MFRDGRRRKTDKNGVFAVSPVSLFLCFGVSFRRFGVSIFRFGVSFRCFCVSFWCFGVSWFRV